MTVGQRSFVKKREMMVERERNGEREMEIW
jgi:hypothetical protein